MVETRTVVTIDGTDYDLRDCTWLHFAPCGCLGGVAAAWAYPADEEKVAIELTGTRTVKEAKRDKGAGYTLRLVPHTEFVEKYAEAFKGECPHSPKWGIMPDPVPPGYAWGHDKGIYRHLVAAERVADTTYDPETRQRREEPRHTEGAALCGGGGSGRHRWAFWTNCGGHLYGETIACLKCVAAANRIAPPLITADAS